MQQTLPVRVAETIAYLRGEIDRYVLRQASIAFDHFGERRAVDQFHHDEVVLTFAPDVVDVHDVRMREFCRVLRFGIEALHKVAIGGKMRAQHFYGNAPPQHGIHSAVNDGHAALADAAFQPVALREIALDHVSAQGPLQ